MSWRHRGFLNERPIHVPTADITICWKSYKKISRKVCVFSLTQVDMNSNSKVCNFFQILELLHSRLSLQRRHNECNGVSNHRRLDCLLKRLFRGRSKKTSRLHVIGLCEGNSPLTSEFPDQRASNAENVSIWWCPNVVFIWQQYIFLWDGESYI